MADPTADQRATAAIKRFLALSPAIRGGAILDGERIVASSGDPATWLQPGRAMLAAADSAAGETATHAHVATGEGEAFVVRLGTLAMVAVTGRFTLASLVLADMRTTLREAA